MSQQPHPAKSQAPSQAPSPMPVAPPAAAPMSSAQPPSIAAGSPSAVPPSSSIAAPGPNGLPTAYGMVVWPSLPGLQQAAVGVAPPPPPPPPQVALGGGPPMGRGGGTVTPPAGRGGIPTALHAAPSTPIASSATDKGGAGGQDLSANDRRKQRVGISSERPEDPKVRSDFDACPTPPFLERVGGRLFCGMISAFFLDLIFFRVFFFLRLCLCLCVVCAFFAGEWDALFVVVTPRIFFGRGLLATAKGVYPRRVTSDPQLACSAISCSWCGSMSGWPLLSSTRPVTPFQCSE